MDLWHDLHLFIYEEETMLEGKILISVVVITYNHGKYVNKALDSIIEQELFSQCEVLIGDDGSKDNTVEILKKYAEKYKNINVYAHENVGISKNVYDLFSICKGEYIAILEGDDYWINPRKLNIQIEQIESNQCIAAAGNSLIVDDNGNEYGVKNNRSKSVIVRKKDVERYGTELWMPSGLMLKNVFLNKTDDKLKVIRDASRMGGNHTGMIYLLGSMGNIYLDNNALCVWRRNVDNEKASNYSSSRHDSIPELSESLNKYYIYQRVLGVDQSRNIVITHLALKRRVWQDIKKEIGVTSYIKARTSILWEKSIIYRLWKKCLKYID